MKVHIYIDAEDLIRLDYLVNLLHANFYPGEDTTVQYYTSPKAYKLQDNIIEVSLSSEDFINLTDRDVLKKIQLIQN